MEKSNGKTSVRLGSVILGCGLLHSCGFETIDTGHRGIFVKFGEIQGEPVTEGFYTYNPFTTSLHEIDVRERKLEKTTSVFTKDTQHVGISFAITYYPDPNKIHQIYKQFGKDWQDKIIEPVALGSVRDVIGRYVADDLVGKLEIAKADSERELKDKLATRDIFLTRLDFTGVDFDAGYKAAIEAKVIAVQRAAEAKNKTVEIEENAKQSVIAAKAEAQSMTIRSQALSQNKGLVDYEAVQRWDGKLPQYMMGDSMPFIKLGEDK